MTTSVFTSGEAGYYNFRIPVLTATPEGQLLAFAEARKQTGSDYDPIDLVLKISADGGETFSELTRVAAGEQETFHNACVCAEADAVHLFYCKNYQEIFYTKSVDGGRTYAPARRLDVLDEFRQTFPFVSVATGPGKAARLGNWLYVPFWAARGDEKHPHHNSVFGFFKFNPNSGEAALCDVIPESVLRNASEGNVVAIGDDLAFAVRQESAYRAFAVAKNDRFTEIVLDPQLPEIVCMAPMIGLPDGRLAVGFLDGERTGLGFGVRKNLYVLVFDGREVVARLPVKHGRAGYSDLAAIGRELFVLYEDLEESNQYDVGALTLIEIDL